MATLTNQELHTMRKNLQTRFREREIQRIVLLDLARDNFTQIVKMIIEKYHPKRIYQWGSLIDGRHFTERSDIDIAIEGITSAEQFFAILGEAEKLTNFPIDLVQMESVHALHAESIRRKGKIVYEE
jgi:predicted nucleotidyltransferase